MPNKNNPENQPTKKTKYKRSALRTLRADAAEFLKSKKLSAIDLAAMKQQAKKDSPYGFASQKSSFFENKKIIIICLILLLGAGSAFFLLSKKNITPPKTQVLKPPAPIIPAQEEKILNIKTIDDLKNQISLALNATYNPGDLVYLPLKMKGDEKTADYYFQAFDFLNITSNKIPPSLTTFLMGNFFIGLINLDRNHPVIIFEVKGGQYENVFGGMLQWEKTILNDLNYLLISNSVLAGYNTIFKDKIIQNSQVRITQLNDKTILLYTFLNKNYIIITDSVNALEEIMHRFIIFKFS